MSGILSTGLVKVRGLGEGGIGAGETGIGIGGGGIFLRSTISGVPVVCSRYWSALGTCLPSGDPP